MVLAAPTIAKAETDLAELFAKTSPSVVTLTTYSATGAKIGQGSGFIVDKSGVIVTCNHVVARAAAIEVETPDETVQTATEIIRTDKDWDVALIRVPGLSKPPLKLAAPEAVRVGTAVVAIGSPMGYGNTLSQGIISGLRPHAGGHDLIQITAPISPGSSGSPILSTANGEILGIAVGSLTAAQNINFAAPAHIISDQLKTLDQEPERKLTDLAPEIKKALAEAKKARAVLDKECTEADANVINSTIEEAVASGVGIFNNGDHLGCFRVYEGAAYKILFKLSNRSATTASVLTSALHRAETTGESADAATAKAWIMRGALDSLVGVHGHPATIDNLPTPK